MYFFKKMILNLFILFVSLLPLSFCSGQIIFPAPLSKRIVEYDINVKLDPSKKILNGSETLIWKNPSKNIISELRFHLYLNAFKNTNSTFIKESGGQLRGDRLDINEKLNWGWIDVTSMKVKGGEDLTGKIKFIHPDDDNADDETVISVPLAKPVPPGGSITLEINFISKLPKIFARTGFSDDYFLAGQWFPKIGVYEPAGERYSLNGQWNCHQFHANSEFYADFGVFNVNITVPKKYVVGAVGSLQKEINNSDGTKTLTYRAEDVIDFAWTASPRFKVASAKWNNVNIRVLLQPEHYSQADRHINSVEAALAYFNKYLGEYPYPTLTIVDPPFRGLGSAGMEYPTFITAGCLWGIPRGIRLTEMVTIHEFGHNYFMGMLATNEFEEAWMDEGMNTYYENRIMDNTYGPKKSYFNLFGFHFGDFEQTRASYVGMRNPKIAPDEVYAWQFPDNSYGTITYMKTATWMKTLEGLVGLGVMDEIMKTYFEEWKFKHPCARDFINVVNKVVSDRLGNKFGPNMDWFFDEVLYGTGICDYKLAGIANRKITGPSGIYDSSGTKMYYGYKRTAGTKPVYESKVSVYRMGDVMFPVDVLVHFKDGKELLETWDGKARTHVFVYNRAEPIVWAKVDPYNKIPMDVNLINNSLAVTPGRTPVIKYAAKFLFWVENALISFGSLF